MNDQERIYLEIEKASYKEVIKQFTGYNCDIRMSTSMDELLSLIEDKIDEINIKLDLPLLLRSDIARRKNLRI